MTVPEVLTKLEGLGDAKVRAQNTKRGAHENQFGVKLGDVRKVTAAIGTDNELAKALWETGNIDARFVAILIANPKTLSVDEIIHMVRSERFTWIADWLSSYIIKEHPDKEELRQQWMQSADPMEARAGWSLTAGCVTRQPEGIDIPTLLDRIEKEMPTAPPETQWTMNTTLAQIGINHPEYRGRALEIGECLGICRDYPVSKGCTSPFAPIWINEMVKRQG
ncbi:MAG TPA: DNA alkylation repair protein [Mucilaginibacter sp.]|jgi:3-methyladenine DNA glycosylase AlkD|nr:DNA alkylation repair protein [Mucilaginibacter sp.]